MTDKEQIKAIIKKYADKGERLLEEAYENGEHASTTGYWDGYGDCANLLLRELDDMQEESKVCMYSKDDYTDEDRKVLCDGCKEECKFNKKEYSVNNGLDLGCGVIWRDEEPVSEDFEVEVKKLWMEINTGHSYSIVDSYNIFYGLCMDIAEWQKQKDANLIFNAKEDGYRLGLATMKQQMMAKAVDGFVIEDIEEGNGDFLLSAEYLSKDIGLKDRQKVKVIVIKDD